MTRAQRIRRLRRAVERTGRALRRLRRQHDDRTMTPPRSGDGVPTTRGEESTAHHVQSV